MYLDVGAELRRPKIDVHQHVWPKRGGVEASDETVALSKRVGITELWCSAPIATGLIASMDEVCRVNDSVLAAMKRHPYIIRGMCFVIPGYYKEAIAEVERCLNAGMIGIKLYNQRKIWDPAVWPIIELSCERHVPILIHAGHGTPETEKEQPFSSDGADIARASQHYPEAILINAHIGGGGDLEWSLKALRDASPKVYVDISGSNLDSGQVEMAITELGIERVLFATDETIEGCVGKILGTGLSEAAKGKIYWGNAAHILAAQGLKPLSPELAAKLAGGAQA